MTNWSRGLTRLYLVLWVVGGLVATYVAWGMVVPEVMELRNLDEYITSHKVTLKELREVKNVWSVDYEGETTNEKEYFEAARTAQSYNSLHRGSMVATRCLAWAIVVILLPGAALMITRWVASGFRSGKV